MCSADEHSSSGFQLTDDKLFEGIYALYGKQVYAVCYNNLKNIEVAQDIFLSLWEHRETLIITTSVEHYLVRAAKMNVFEYIRNKTSHTNHLAIIQAEATTLLNCTERDIEYNSYSYLYQFDKR